MALGFPPTPFSQVTTGSPGEPSYGIEIYLTPAQIAQLRTDVVRLSHSFPTLDGESTPRTLELRVGQTNAHQYACIESYAPPGTDHFTARVYSVVVSPGGRKRLQSGQQVYCSLGTDGSFWLLPAKAPSPVSLPRHHPRRFRSGTLK